MPVFPFPVFLTQSATWAVLSEQHEPFAPAFLPIQDIFCPRCGRSIRSLSLWHSKMIPRLCLPCVFGTALSKHFHCEHNVLCDEPGGTSRPCPCFCHHPGARGERGGHQGNSQKRIPCPPILMCHELLLVLLTLRDLRLSSVFVRNSLCCACTPVLCGCDCVASAAMKSLHTAAQKLPAALK